MSRSTVFRLRLTVWNNMASMNNNNNNNNNNQNPLIQIRDRLFQVMFVRFSIGYARLVPHFARKVIENTILSFALLSLFVLAYIHATFIHSPMNCLDTIQKDWPRDGILRIEVIPYFKQEDYTLQKSYEKELKMRQYQGYSIPHLDIVWHEVDNGGDKSDDSIASEGFDNETLEIDSLTLNTSGEFPVNKEESESSEDSLSNWLNKEKLSNNNTLKKTDLQWPSPIIINDKGEFDQYWIDGIYIVEYSLEYGFLKLSLTARRQLKIPVKLIVLDPEVEDCFGNWFTKGVLHYFIGYDDVLLASLSKLASKEENKGYIRNVVTEHYFRFVNVMNHTSYFVAALIMLSFTFFISTLLRYSHHQIFIFIVQVLRFVEFRASTVIPLASLMTVILALVGMEAIMSEFFSDPTTSFYVIVIVWTADQYDAICCRTVISRRHWLRFFFLYHFGFYAYDYRFSGQYSDAALFTTCCFILHSMVFFFHRYELPAILRSLEHGNNLPPRPPHHHHHRHHHHHHHHHHHPGGPPSPDEPPQPPPPAESEASARSETEANRLPDGERSSNQMREIDLDSILQEDDGRQESSQAAQKEDGTSQNELHRRVTCNHGGSAPPTSPGNSPEEPAAASHSPAFKSESANSYVPKLYELCLRERRIS